MKVLMALKSVCHERNTVFAISYFLLISFPQLHPITCTNGTGLDILEICRLLIVLEY